MTERLVSYVEPRLRKRVLWGGVTASIAFALLVRLLASYEPIFIGAALVVPFFGTVLLLHFLVQREQVTVLERTRIYQSVFPYWERVLLRALAYGVPLGLLRADRVETLRDLAVAVLIFTAAGLVFSVAVEWIAQWAQRDAARREGAL